MKKAVLILAVLVVFSTLAFASPNVSFGIWGRTLFVAAQGTSAGGDITQIWGPDWAAGGGPTERIDLTFISDAAEFAFRFNNNNGNWWEQSLDNMFGTLKFIPDLLTVRIGKFTGDGFDLYRKNTPRDVHNDNIGRMNGYGILFTTAPKDTNFDATVWYMTPSIEAPALKATDNLARTGFAASYTLPNLLKFAAGTLTDGGDIDVNLHRNVFARVEFLMVPNLKAFADVYVVGLFEKEAISPITGISAFAAADYSMDALALALAIQVKLPMPKAGGNFDTSMTIWPEVMYNLGDVTVGVDATVGVALYGSGADPLIGVNVTPSAKLNKFNTTFGLSLDFSSAPASNVTWKLPITVDFSMW